MDPTSATQFDAVAGEFGKAAHKSGSIGMAATDGEEKKKADQDVADGLDEALLKKGKSDPGRRETISKSIPVSDG